MSLNQRCWSAICNKVQCALTLTIVHCTSTRRQHACAEQQQQPLFAICVWTGLYKHFAFGQAPIHQGPVPLASTFVPALASLINNMIHSLKNAGVLAMSSREVIYNIVRGNSASPGHASVNTRAFVRPCPSYVVRSVRFALLGRLCRS